MDRVRWAQDTTQLNEKHNSEMAWAYFSTSARSAISCYHEIDSDPENSRELYRRLIASNVIESWRTHSNREDEFAMRAAHESLNAIHINSAEEFFSVVNQGATKDFNWPHLTDTTNTDYIAIKQFVEDSLDEKHANQNW